mmetsp:Transcript_30015/g.96256  ORF Transcript_30015/g.96256 Transcript_30015/m.96256 type:complete len:232 (+) Transcript_30015:631-1326(+)
MSQPQHSSEDTMRSGRATAMRSSSTRGGRCFKTQVPNLLALSLPTWTSPSLNRFVLACRCQLIEGQMFSELPWLGQESKSSATSSISPLPCKPAMSLLLFLYKHDAVPRMVGEGDQTIVIGGESIRRDEGGVMVLQQQLRKHLSAPGIQHTHDVTCCVRHCYPLAHGTDVKLVASLSTCGEGKRSNEPPVGRQDLDAASSSLCDQHFPALPRRHTDGISQPFPHDSLQVSV